MYSQEFAYYVEVNVSEAISFNAKFKSTQNNTKLSFFKPFIAFVMNSKTSEI